MKDMPIFTTENGAASLTLREIPYRKQAFIRIHSSANVEALLTECVDFCRAVGADKIYATGDNSLEKYPVHAKIVKMIGLKKNFRTTAAKAMLIEAADIPLFQDLYNEKMADVPNASYMTLADATTLCINRKAYIIRENQEILGIGVAGNNEIEAIATVAYGRGECVLSALAEVLIDQEIYLEVAAENKRAMALYNRMGFQIVETIAIWYKIF